MTNEITDMEVTPTRLPFKLSDFVDDAVRKFVDEHAFEDMKVHRRWHGADLWMIYQDSVDEGEKSFVTRRVVIGAYSDDPDILSFIPDTLVTRLDGTRYVLQNAKRRESKLSSSVFGMIIMAMQDDMQSLTVNIEENLKKAWNRAQSFPANEATVPLP